jgi:hypothetical protein
MRGDRPMIAISITKRLSIALLLGAAMAIHASAQIQKDATASPALQKEFDGFIARFRAALKANDSAAVAGMTQLPFQNSSSVRDAAQFHAEIYRHDFTAKNRACIRRRKAV